MIYHYVNLTVWKALNEGYSVHTDKFFCDSISLLFLANFFGKSPAFVPGTTVSEIIDKYVDSKRSLFLVSSASCAIYYKHSFVLPFYSDKIFIDPELNEYIVKNAPQVIFIGISSPKQNFVAKKIQEILPDSEIYCIGAALNCTSSINKVSKFSKTGFEWVVFLAKHPKRTLSKMYLTITSLFEIFFSKKQRREFVNFCEKLEM